MPFLDIDIECFRMCAGAYKIYIWISIYEFENLGQILTGNILLYKQYPNSRSFPQFWPEVSKFWSIELSCNYSRCNRLILVVDIKAKKLAKIHVWISAVFTLSKHRQYIFETIHNGNVSFSALNAFICMGLWCSTWFCANSQKYQNVSQSNENYWMGCVILGHFEELKCLISIHFACLPSFGLRHKLACLNHIAAIRCKWNNFICLKCQDMYGRTSKRIPLIESLKNEPSNLIHLAHTFYIFRKMQIKYTRHHDYICIVFISIE